MGIAEPDHRKDTSNGGQRQVLREEYKNKTNISV